MKQHQELLTAAIEREGEAQRALISGDGAAAAAGFEEASALYRSSWELAPPTSYGRLVGMVKAAVLAGGGEEAARYARAALGEGRTESPTASYAQAVAALILDEDDRARRSAEPMRSGGDAFARTAEAIVALAARDAARYEVALRAIVADFESRADHLTAVAIADTALMLQRLAARRGMSAELDSPVLPRS